MRAIFLPLRLLQGELGSPDVNAILVGAEPKASREPGPEGIERILRERFELWKLGITLRDGPFCARGRRRWG